MKFKRIRQIERVISAEIRKFNEPELKRLVGECQNLTTTNCSWIMYGLKNIVIELARSSLRWRKIEKDLATKQKEKEE